MLPDILDNVQLFQNMPQKLSLNNLIPSTNVENYFTSPIYIEIGL